MKVLDVRRYVRKHLETVYDEDLNDALEELTLRIQHYCNLPETPYNEDGALPAGLQPVLARMTVDLMRMREAEAEGAETAGAVESIKLGDTTVAFGGKASSASSPPLADTLLSNYLIDLRRYRRLPV